MSTTLASLNLWKALELSANWDRSQEFFDVFGYGIGAAAAQFFAWVFGFMGVFAALFALVGGTKPTGSSKMIAMRVIAVVLGIAAVAMSVSAWVIVESL